MKDSFVERIMEKVTYDDLNSDGKLIADIVGLENFKNLIIAGGGMAYHIPSVTYFNKQIKEVLTEDIETKTLKQIKRETNLSLKYIIKTIGKEQYKKIQKARMD